MAKIRIDVGEVIANQNERVGFNRPALADIEFHYDGRVIPVSESEIKEFEFVGLNNVDFILNRDWPENPKYKS